MKMKLVSVRSWLVIQLIGLTVLCACPCDAEKRPLRVGVVAPLSGSAQIYGIAVRNGLELAREENKDLPIEFFYEDDQFLPSRTVSAVHQLIDRNKVDLLIVVASTPSNAVAPIAEQRKVPLIAWASDRTSSLGRRYVVRSWMSGFEEGKKIASEAARRSLKNVASVLSVSDYPRSVQEGFEGSFTGKVVVSEEVPAETKDFRAILGKAKRLGAEGFFICLNPGLSGLFARQAAEVKAATVFFGCENLHDRAEVDSSHGALVGGWFVSATATDAFRKKYLSRYGDESLISGAAIHYDIVYLLKDLVERWQEGEELRNLLMSFAPRQGGIGEFEPRKEGDDQFFKVRLIVKEITKDGFVESGR